MIDLEIGVKTDPIEYRYSYEWLFRLLAEEEIKFVQFGTFCELYHLPDDYFCRIRNLAKKYDIKISSVFTAHRELGGFFVPDPCWHKVARKNYERLIDVGSLLGASSVGSNPGAVMRDQIAYKTQGLNNYLSNLKELLHVAWQKGICRLTIEPMSCIAEPPTLPKEIRSIFQELKEYHNTHLQTSDVGCCTDVSHGYVDKNRNIIHDNLELFMSALPYTTELHIKNTDAIFHSTFGFTDQERQGGIVDIVQIRKLLLTHANILPVKKIICYLEIEGPKTGRDHSDRLLIRQLCESIRYVKNIFIKDYILET